MLTKTKFLQYQAVIFALNRKKVQISTPLLRVRPCNFAHVFNVPLPSLLRTVSYTHLRAHETEADLVCRLLLEKKNNIR